MLSINWKKLWFFCLSVTLLFVYNEYLVYYVVLLQCSWPQLNPETADFSQSAGYSEPLRVMIVADTHLLGSREGHWFDKLRREWQMERSFQSCMMIHSPNVVFVLGDLFDEGKWCSDLEFHQHVQRFKRMFRHSDHTDLEVVVGNHDIGFHYMIDDQKRKRFASAFSAPSVRLLRIRENSFVIVNSMALEGDGCSMCAAAEEKLQQISLSLKCAKGVVNKGLCSQDDDFMYTRPILLQHFPLYRESDANCTGPDAAPVEEKHVRWKEKYDTLSKTASKQLLEWLEPRLVVSAHTHHFCHHTHTDGTPEWTVPSFSWRYKPNPSFLLMQVSNNNYAIQKCFLPQESTVIYTYIVGGALILLWFIFPRSLFPSPGGRSGWNKTL